jgi:hypothetical protein
VSQFDPREQLKIWLLDQWLSEPAREQILGIIACGTPIDCEVRLAHLVEWKQTQFRVAAAKPLAAAALAKHEDEKWERFTDPAFRPWHQWLATRIEGLRECQLAQDATPPALPVQVDVATRTVSFDGALYDVSEQAARWLKVLADHRGEWISGEQLAGHDPELDGVRTDRLRSRLPDSVRALIDSKPGAGSRMRRA